MRIYLSGGFHSGWQDGILLACPHHEFADPRRHGLQDEQAYTLWDLEAIRRADMVLAYAERGNPSLLGLSLEVGWAKGLGKRIIYVEDAPEHPSHRYLGMVRACADVTFSNLEDAIALLILLPG